MRIERTIGESRGMAGLLVLAGYAGAVLLLVMPLAIVFVSAFGDGLSTLLRSLTDPDAVDSIRLTLLVAMIVVPLNTAFGLAAAWCTSHFRFRGRALLEALIELPFSVSPVIAGLIYVMLFGLQGWFGAWLRDHDIRIIFALPGIVLSTLFVTLPFVARQVAPTMRAQGYTEEEAALTLGAGGWQMFMRITLPKIKWALLYGILLCNARAMGEFGAVAVVSGHIRGATNTMPLQIENLYNGYNLTAAFGMAALLALLAVATILLRMALEWRQTRMIEVGQAARLGEVP
jgi:sulfate/thiosulfate transport system permease protein